MPMVIEDEQPAPPKWTVERTLAVLTFLVSVLAFTFSLGMNWAQIAGLDKRVTALEQEKELRAKENDVKYVPRELWRNDMDGINHRLDELVIEVRAVRAMRDR